MRMDFAPKLLPFDLEDRPGSFAGLAPTKLSGADLAGMPYKLHKPRADKTAFAPTLTGIAGIDAKAATADPAQHRAQLEAHAGQLVSQTFFGTLLKQMRDSPFKSELFEGGKGGQAFSQLYDQRLVEQMSRGAGKKLINAIVRKFEARQAYGRQQGGAAGATGSAAANTPAALDGPMAIPTIPPSLPLDNHPTFNPRTHVTPARRA